MWPVICIYEGVFLTVRGVLYSISSSSSSSSSFIFYFISLYLMGAGTPGGPPLFSREGTSLLKASAKRRLTVSSDDIR